MEFSLGLVSVSFIFLDIDNCKVSVLSCYQLLLEKTTMSDKARKRRMEEARKQRAEADLKLRRVEDEARLEEACEEERKRVQVEKARMEEQKRIDEKTQLEWEKRRTSLTRSPPPSGSAANPGLETGRSTSSLAGTDADENLSKKRQRLSPGQHMRQHKKTKKDEADEELEIV